MSKKEGIKMKRVLLTGGAGFVGSHVIDHWLSNTDWHIIILDRLDVSGNLNRIAESQLWQKNKDRVSFVWHDLKSAVNDMIAKRIGKINYIFHLAAGSHVDRSIIYPMEFCMDNVVGTVNLLDYAITLDGLEKFNYFSTDEVMGPAPKDINFAEGSPHRPNNPYAACLLPETLVLCGDGSEKKIENIKSGDIVQSFNKEAAKVENKKVINTFRYKVAELYKINIRNREIYCTPNHKFLVKNANGFLKLDSGQNLESEWVEANNLQKGDLIATVRQTNGVMWQPIMQQPIKSHYSGDVIDIEVEDNHNYIIEQDIVSHNSKAAAEDFCVAYQNTYKMPIFRTNSMNIFGSRQHPEKFIPKVIKSVLNGEQVPIHSNAEKTKAGSRFWIHARNVAAALLFLADKAESDGHYHIVGEKEVDNLELAQMISDIIGKPLKYEMVDFHSSRPGHDLRYGMTSVKMPELGWQLPVTFEKSLEKTVQ